MPEKTLQSSWIYPKRDKIALTYSPAPTEWADQTFGEFQDVVKETTKILPMIGVQKKDRVLIAGENHCKWLSVFLGIAGYGAVAVPIDGNIAKSKLLGILDDCKPKAILVSKAFEERFTSLFNDIYFPSRLLNFHFDLLASKGAISAQITDGESPAPTNLAAIIYTSGTTGRPKGIMLTHSGFTDAIEIGIKMGGIQQSDVMLTMLPFTHVFGLVDSGLCLLSCGARNILLSSMNPNDIFHAIHSYKVTFINAVPRLAEIFLAILQKTNQKLNGVKMFIGGASCRSEVIHGLCERGIQAVQGFGMTETAGGIVACQGGPPESVGRPFPPVEFKISQSSLGAGEILIYSPTLMSGIYQQPELYRSLFDGKFFKSGDLGEIDKNGYLYIRGRLKDLIITSGGLKVHPDELEMRLGILPFAEEFSVIGIKTQASEAPVLVIRPKAEFFEANAVSSTKEYILAKISELSKEWPEHERFSSVIEWPTPLPRSASQKVQRNVLQKLVKADILKSAGKSLSTDEGDQIPFDSFATGIELSSDDELKAIKVIRTIVADFLNIKRVDLTIDTPFSIFEQLDSLGKVALLANFENAARLSIKDVQEDDFIDLRSFIKMVFRNASLTSLKNLDLSKPSFSEMPAPRDYSSQAVLKRQKFLEFKSKADLSAFKDADYTKSKNLAGNIEGLFGFGQIPLGVIGPLRVNGEFAKGEFFVPIATTEGALVSSIERGTLLIGLAGGANVKVLSDSLTRTPVFLFSSLVEMMKFSDWLERENDSIKCAAENTSHHGKLLSIETFPMGTHLTLRFVYSTGDASGQNMVTIATQAAIDYITKNYPGHIDDYFLECNLSGDKKINAFNFTRNRGKKVIAEVSLSKELVEKYLHTTPQRLCKMSELGLIGSLYAHSFGVNAQYANILSAIFIATGQDPACVAESACGVTHIELRQEKVLISVTMPGLMVGTVGGGTRLPTQQACLQIIECDGAGKSKKFAEIIAATALAGEISLIGAMAAGEFTMAHAKYGRHSNKL